MSRLRRIFIAGSLLLLLDGCGAPRAETLSFPTLKEAGASHGRLVGTEVEAALLRSDATYAGVVRREFSVVVPQNEMKFGWVSKTRGRYDFTDADAIVEFARRNGMMVRGHTFAWHRNLPKWLLEGRFSGAELAEILSSHIRAEAGHFRGKLIAWDVVNEAVDRNGKLRSETPWAKIGGSPGDYIPLAFKTAREADPRANLFYNDYGIEEVNAKSDAVFALLSSLKAKGVPIDGIGFQMHLDYRQTLDLASVRRNMDRFAGLGLRVQITEFDYQLPQSPGPELLEKEADAYRDAARVCVSIPGCEAFLSWGFTDAHSWIPSAFQGYGSALYFDEHYRPKPAYRALLEGLAGH